MQVGNKTQILDIYATCPFCKGMLLVLTAITLIGMLWVRPLSATPYFPVQLIPNEATTESSNVLTYEVWVGSEETPLEEVREIAIRFEFPEQTPIHIEVEMQGWFGDAGNLDLELTPLDSMQAGTLRVIQKDYWARSGYGKIARIAFHFEEQVPPSLNIKTQPLAYQPDFLGWVDFDPRIKGSNLTIYLNEFMPDELLLRGVHQEKILSWDTLGEDQSVISVKIPNRMLGAYFLVLRKEEYELIFPVTIDLDK